MNINNLLFYNEYEAFYSMACESKAFQAFCRDAFGEDFSQDGFSDIKQIQRILQYIPMGNRVPGEDAKGGGLVEGDVHILDVGCGNGKMLGYLQEATGAYIHGFDYSEQAIKTAQSLFPMNSEFKVGAIGEIDYAEAQFDVITSMDTMYFARDMVAFVAQVKRWMKPEGIFFVGYQEGEVMARTENARITVLANALAQNDMKYEVFDITEETYALLRKKRECAIAHQVEFEAEGGRNWFEMLMGQTECATVPFEEFREKMARYIYVIRK